MAKTDTGSIILYGGGLILAYYVLKSWGIIQTSCHPSICTPQCPRGPRYTRGLFGDCDPGYLMCGTLGGDCCCAYATQSLDNNTSNWNPLTTNEINNIKQTLR